MQANRVSPFTSPFSSPFRVLVMSITKTSVNTTRRCDLTSVLNGLIFDTV